ncbi:ATP-binding cassette domain-containing protein [Bengtsoniella intestinalis]|uniref:sugar ABC transporter ATP-binding protein n=1 Tax=Bengtsoniella intestinalis TaxID=3073143 RepID=UPI00391F424C
MKDAHPLLSMQGINKQFPGVKALDNVQLTLKKGTVHALMGENGAGKSTLMKCLFGIYIEDSGEICIEGKPVKFTDPKQALENGVAMVHQELNQVTKRNVMDNLWLGRYPTQGGLVSDKIMYVKTKEILEDLEIDVDPRAILGNLSVSGRQMVEIAKAVSYNAKILVFDEPTSSLSDTEVAHLFRIINKLRDRGVGMIYISHKMDEILAISDEVTIMRDGGYVSTTAAKDLTMNEIIRQMVGREINDRYPPKTNEVGETYMEVKGLTGMYAPTIKDVSFELKHGEVLGVAGLVGSRRTELLENIFGYATVKSGEIFIKGKKINNRTPRKAIRNGFALLTEERRATGILPVRSIAENATISNLKNCKTGGLIDDKKVVEQAKWTIDSMRVRTPSHKTPIKSLSGGNQQKVIIGRWLLTDPEVLLLDEPTRGIDVGAKYEIYQLINDQATKGKCCMVVSSEMPELLGICDRILVMSNGRMAGIVDAKNTSQEEIMTLATKYQ